MPKLGSFQDCLDAAVKLKVWSTNCSAAYNSLSKPAVLGIEQTAIIKAKPGRQEWEQAPQFLRCTAAATDVVQRARQEAFSIQLSTALQLKEQGNELISKDQERALERYTQALSVFLWFDRGPDRASEDVPLVCAAERLQEAEREQAHHLLATCLCNAAACLLQLELLPDAVYACSKALQYDPYNVKALYRRALAARRTATSAGLEGAVRDLAAANQLEPANTTVRLALAAAQQELREHRRQERGLYGHMFERGELYPQQQQGAGSGSDGGAGIGRFGADRASCGTRGQQQHGGEEQKEDEWGERDPEDLMLLGPEAKKAASARASREADKVLRRMRAAVTCTRTRKLAEQLGGEETHERQRQQGARQAGRFPWWAVPWWAYALIALHLVYRLIKIWRLPVPAGASAGASGGSHTPVQAGTSSIHSEL